MSEKELANSAVAPSGRILVRRTSPKRNWGDAAFKNMTLSFAVIVLGLILLMGYQMYEGARPAIDKFGWSFITSSVWDPVVEEFGALPFIFGTLVSSTLALLIAVPLSLGIAIVLSELIPPAFERPLSFLIELLAGIPSIVYGLWGIFVLVPWVRTSVEPPMSEYLGFLPLFHGAPYGFGMLTAGLILSVMILPIIASISRDVLKSVPQSQREASLAIGATRWESIRLILNDAKSGIVGAILLGLGRAIGETMAVTMVIGYTMASVLANEFTEATTSMYISALMEIALLLFAITIIVNMLARLLVWSVTRKA
jgi:phosphate transport system permease protein